MWPIETHRREIRTQLFTKAFFAAKRALHDENPQFPESNLLKDNLMPSYDTQNLILHFKMQKKSLFKKKQLKEKDFMKEEKIFLDKMKLYPWPSDIPVQNTEENREFEARSMRNVRTSISLIIDGCSIKPGKEKRRTGESTFIHALRTFVRGNSELSYIGMGQRSLHYTTLLARILHDAQEDFDGFKMTLENPTSDNPNRDQSVLRYKVTFDKQKKPYYLYLRPDEAKLLQMQLDAVSVPPEIAQMPDGFEKSEAQVQHLLTKTNEIYNYKEVGENDQVQFKFGAIEAYQTLRIKLDDRIDNVLTYYAGNGPDHKEKLKDKLQETILFFREVEQQAKKYFTEYKQIVFKRSSRDVPVPQSDSTESIVAFCYYLLYGGSYENFFQESIKKVAQGQKNMKLDIDIFTKFLIPSLNPAAPPRTVSPIKIFN